MDSRAVAAAVVIAAALGASTGHAQPTPAAAPPEADLGRAKDLYQAAEAELADDHVAEAVRDYAASYELSHDSALLFKLGRAHERAGQCDVARDYYQRYLRDGQPTEQFTQTTNERIAACTPAKPPTPPPAPTPPPPAPTPAPGLPRLSHQRQAAWLVTGSAVGAIALGGVLAYAARSQENDVRDLYAGGTTPTYNTATQQRYRDLIDQGRQYQHLSWAAFGTAGAAAVAAALLFWLDDQPEAPRVAPAVDTHSAGVSVRF